MHQLDVRRNSGWGRLPNWSPDADSAALLDIYWQGRLKSSPAPATGTVRRELSYLRSLVFASLSLGGPNTLRDVRDSPAAVCKVMREWPRAQRTLGALLASGMRLIDLTIEDGTRAGSLKRDIVGGLYPRPPRSQRWDLECRTVGGSKLVQSRRPVLSAVDLSSIVAATPLGGPAGTALRDKAIVSLACHSGLHLREIATLRWEQLQWFEFPQEAPWCAIFTGILRRARVVSIPISREAEPELRGLLAAAAYDGRQASGHLFTPLRARTRPLSYWTSREVVRRAVRDAGLPTCDDMALKRAYAAQLKQRGLNEYAIRDALGLKSMTSLELLLRQHRWAAAQRVASEHHVLQLAPPIHPTTPASQLRLALAPQESP